MFSTHAALVFLLLFAPVSAEKTTTLAEVALEPDFNNTTPYPTPSTTSPNPLDDVEDPLTKEILANINHTVSPCDNFYRHRCPHHIAYSKSPGRWALSKVWDIVFDELRGNLKDQIFIEYIGSDDESFSLRDFLDHTQKRCRTSVDCYKEVYTMLNTAIIQSAKFPKECGMINWSEAANLKRGWERELWEASLSIEESVQLHAYQSVIEKAANHSFKTCQYSTEFHERQITRDIVLRLYEALKLRQAARDNLIDEVRNYTEYDPLAKLDDDIRNAVKKAFRKTSYLKTEMENDEPWLSVFLKSLDKIPTHIPLSGIDRNESFLNDVIGDYEEAYYRARTITPSKTRRASTIRHLYARAKIEEKYTGGIAQHLEDYFDESYNAYNSINMVTKENFISIYKAWSIATQNSPPSVLYGFLGATLAHEYFHTFTWFDDQNIVDFRKSPKYIHKEQCLLQANRKFINQSESEHIPYGDGHIREDAPDLEGTRVAFAALKQNQNPEENANVFGNLTHAQLFFYSMFAADCNEPLFDDEQHSLSVLRVNAVFRQMTEFQEAFNCKPDDFMVLPEEARCYYYGSNSDRDYEPKSN